MKAATSHVLKNVNSHREVFFVNVDYIRGSHYVRNEIREHAVHRRMFAPMVSSPKTLSSVTTRDLGIVNANSPGCKRSQQETDDGLHDK